MPYQLATTASHRHSAHDTMAGRAPFSHTLPGSRWRAIGKKGTLSRIVLTRNLLRTGRAPTLWIGLSHCHSPCGSRKNRGCGIVVESCYSCKSETWYNMITDTCYSICVRKCFIRELEQASSHNLHAAHDDDYPMILRKLTRA